MKEVIICEKKTVADELYEFLKGKKRKEEGYSVVINESKETVITYTYGHVFKIVNEVGSKWELDKLPIFPNKFIYENIGGNKIKIFNTIKSVLKGAERVIVSTDAGREGEIIAREVLDAVNPNWRKDYDVKRLWTSEALTQEVVNREIANLKDISKFDGAYYKALARQHADWIVGVNITRDVSLRNDAGTLSVGRVQTPILSMIVSRCKEIEAFTKQFSYTLVFLGVKGGTFESEKESLKKEDIDTFVNRLKGKNLVIKSVEIGSEKKEHCKELHSLTTLQQEANRKFGMTANETLEVAQGLYEKHKVITYPRTDSRYLAESSRDMFKEILRKIGKGDLVEMVDGIGKELFDSSKLTDHHALIVSNLPKDNFSAEERKIYTLIYDRMMGFFMGDFIYKNVSVKGLVDDVEFKKNYKKVISRGWKKAKDEEEEQGDEDEMSIDFREGEIIGGESLNRKNETKPPRFFNDDLILGKMDKLGLGTPATRHEIIEKLIIRSYMFRDGKHLKDTVKGRSLIEYKLGSQLISPEMTSSMEMKIEKIENERDYKNYMEEIKEFVRGELGFGNTEAVQGGLSSRQIEVLTKFSKDKGVKVDLLHGAGKADYNRIKEQIDEEGAIHCKCGERVKEGEKAFYCPKCEISVYKVVAGKKLTRAAAKKIMKGEGVLVKGLTSQKTGKPFDATLKVVDGKVTFIYDKK